MREGLWRCLREPLLHFLVAGLLLFAAYELLDAARPSEPGAQVELTEDHLRQLRAVWLAQGRPPPTPSELQSLVEKKVREEILYREALALGLDKDDTIIKRRLAQKMAFLAEEASVSREPTPQELRSWFEDHRERFALPPRASFRHLYFSPDRRGGRAGADARLALEKLGATGAETPFAEALADPFMFQDSYSERSYEQLAALFGDSFAQQLLELTPGSWQGPVESGYGWHLVWLDSVTPARLLPFESVEAELRAAWVADQRAAGREKAFEALRERYQVVLPPGAGAGAPPDVASR